MSDDNEIKAGTPVVLNWPCYLMYCPSGDPTALIRHEFFKVPGWSYKEWALQFVHGIAALTEGLQMSEQVFITEFIALWNKRTLEKIHATKEQAEEAEQPMFPFTFKEPQGEA